MLHSVSMAFVVILLSVASLSMGQVPSNQQTPCSSRFETAVASQCFTASGVNFTGVLYVISGNMSGAIPTGFTYASFLQLLCSSVSQDKVITCVLGQMNKHNTSQCSLADRNTVFGRGGQLLAFMETICGQSCEQESTQSLIQCFSVSSMHPERILSQNASITDDKYSIIGTNETEIDIFCKNRQTLFSCLSPLPSTCPGLMKRLYAIGVDLQAMETATGFLCSSKQQYLTSLNCLGNPSPEMAQCAQNTAANMRTTFLGRYQTGAILPSQYQDRLCKTKLTQVACELAAFEKICDTDSASLRTLVECSMLPLPCRESSPAELRDICAKVTTPSPTITVRPTQGRPGAVPLDRNPSDASSVRVGTNTATPVDAMLATPLLLVFVSAVISI